MQAIRGINATAFDYYPCLNRVRTYFESNYSLPFYLSDAAELAGLETKHFGKFFRRAVGIGFKKWTTIVRVKIAMDLLRANYQRLGDVASATGFEELRTFERAFKKHIGLTPREFRKRALGQRYLA